MKSSDWGLVFRLWFCIYIRLFLSIVVGLQNIIDIHIPTTSIHKDSSIINFFLACGRFIIIGANIDSLVLTEVH